MHLKFICFGNFKSQYTGLNCFCNNSLVSYINSKACLQVCHCNLNHFFFRANNQKGFRINYMLKHLVTAPQKTQWRVMSRNCPLGVRTKASLMEYPWLCHDLRSIKIAGEFLEDLKKNRNIMLWNLGKELNILVRSKFSHMEKEM